jgi:proline iminopeptidase
VTLATYDEDLTALIDRFSPGRPVVLVGQSWGGMYASSFIGRHPERVAGAVLMESGPLTGALFEEVKSGIRSMDLGSEWLNDITWAQTIISPDGHGRADYALLEGHFADGAPGYHASTTDRQPIWRLGAVAFNRLQTEEVKDGKAVWDFTTGLSAYQRPVLFIASELNEVIGADFQRRQLTAYPSAELAIVGGVGHDFPWTQPDATLRFINSYLTKIGF